LAWRLRFAGFRPGSSNAPSRRRGAPGCDDPARLLLRLPLVHAGPAGNASSLLHAVQLMVLADVAMSLDNILALAWRHTQHTLA